MRYIKTTKHILGCVALSVFLRRVLYMARRFGAFTAAQAAVYLGLPLEEVKRRLDRAVEGGALRAVDIAGVRFYYRDPVEAAEVILGSVDVAALLRDERERLMRL